jgi:TonB-dependent SusC/RagA subfamily outer membrane receptor
LGIDFNDSTEVFIQGMKEKGSKNLQVSINTQKNGPKVQIIKTPFNPMEFDAKELADFLRKANEAVELEKKFKLNKVQMLEEVVVKANKQTRDTRKIYGRASNVLKVDNILCAGATNVLQMLQGRVPGVQVSSDGNGGFKVIIRGISSFSLSSDPLFILDGMPSSADILTSINPCDVEQIDVLKGADASIFGSTASNGVISILTKRGSPNYDYTKDPVMGVAVQKRFGYNAPREFYAPKYDEDKPEYLRPDFRSTLHWAPNVRTDSTGKATISYWNTDAKANINIVAEGVAYQGGIGIAKNTYQVK